MRPPGRGAGRPGSEFVDQRAEYGKGRGVLAASLFREKLRQWLQPAVQSRAPEPEFLPVRVLFKERMDDPRERLAAGIERPEIHLPAGGDNFDRRADGHHIPARISLRIFVPGRKIKAAITIQFLPKAPEAPAVRDRGCGAS